MFLYGDTPGVHPGVFCTYCRLRGGYYFPKMPSKVRKFVLSYRECLRRKDMASKQASLASMPEVSQPFERVLADLIEMVYSARCHGYVLVIIDHISRFLQMIALVNQDANSVADAFIENYIT